jgi:hypothetical protein
MVDKCFNPACGHELRYLRGGRVIRIVKEEGDRIAVEHYWLCAGCYASHDFVFSSGGPVTLGPKNKAFLAQDPQNPTDNLVILTPGPELILRG